MTKGQAMSGQDAWLTLDFIHRQAQARPEKLAVQELASGRALS